MSEADRAAVLATINRRWPKIRDDAPEASVAGLLSADGADDPSTKADPGFLVDLRAGPPATPAAVPPVDGTQPENSGMESGADERRPGGTEVREVARVPQPSDVEERLCFGEDDDPALLLPLVVSRRGALTPTDEPFAFEVERHETPALPDPDLWPPLPPCLTPVADDVFPFVVPEEPPPVPRRPAPAAARPTPALDRAAGKAASLIDGFDIRRRRERDVFLNRLVEVFERFPHPASYREVGRLIDAGIEPEDLLTAAEIRAQWEDDPTLGRVRCFSSLERGWTTRVTRDGLSWKTAATLARAYGADEAMRLIRGDWRDDWRTLDDPCDEGFSSFARYVGLLASSYTTPRFARMADRSFTRSRLGDRHA